MSWKLSLAGLLALIGVSAGCATSESTYPYASTTYPSASTTDPYHGFARTDAPQIDNSDAAGVASLPGTRTGVPASVLVPSSPAASPVIIVPPPQPR